MSFDLVHSGSFPGLSCGLAIGENGRADLSSGLKPRAPGAMVKSTVRFPEDLQDEYSGPNRIGEAPQASTYLAQDGLGEDSLITEFFDPDLCIRDEAGAITARPGYEDAWAQRLADEKASIARLSRLVHPALNGIEQVFHTNGTVYAACRPVDGQASDFHSLLSPAEIQKASEALIDLLAYLHAFGVTGLEILPEHLVFDPQQQSFVLSLRQVLEGTMPVPRFDGSGADEDCLVLAKTLHVLITGQPPSSPHVLLEKRCPGYSDSYLSALDRILSADAGTASVCARDWARGAKRHGARSNALHGWALAALLVAAIAAVLIWSLPSSTDAPAPLSLPEWQIEGAGPWQVELPLEVVSAEGVFVLRATDPSEGFMSINPWVQNGLVVTKINGAAVGGPVNLRDIALISDDAASTEGLVTLTIRDPILPLERTVAVIPYLWREKTYGVVSLREWAAPDGWQLVVTTVSEGAAVPLQPGDVLLREEVADQALLRLADLEQALDTLMQQPHPSLTVLIRRAGSQLVVGFAAETLMPPS